MKQNILFLCPHSAAKSVMAAAYCRRLATQYGLDLHITFAGIEPDVNIAPAVAELLEAEGFDTTQYRPRFVTREDLEGAHRIISLGCDVSDLALPDTKIEYWHDVPPPSQALLTARDLIYARVEQLVSELGQFKRA